MELSRITGINRQQIYDEAEELVTLGLYDITRKKRRKYIPADPGTLIKLGNRKINETREVLEDVSKNILPILEDFSHEKKSGVTVIFVIVCMMAEGIAIIVFN